MISLGSVSPRTNSGGNSLRLTQHFTVDRAPLPSLSHVMLLATKYLGWGLPSIPLSPEVAGTVVHVGTQMERKTWDLSSGTPSVVGA